MANRDVPDLKRMSATEARLLDALATATESWPFDRYRHYPAKQPDAWRMFYLRRIDAFLRESSNSLRHDIVGGLPVILGARHSEWDSDHFGFRVAAISVIHSHEDDASNRRCADLLADLLADLRSQRVRFVSARLPGDMIPTIHIFENAGFRYHENIIWPVAPCTDSLPRHQETVRLMREADLPDVLRIAATCQYQRSHFHSDPGFDRRKVDPLYARWIATSFAKGEPIAIVEHEGKAVGYFNFQMDDALKEGLGYSYGRMRSLALDDAVRGLGLGRKLFEGTMRIMRDMGADYIDSGYSTKNHLSARLHDVTGFHSAYEEITVHNWF